MKKISINISLEQLESILFALSEVPANLGISSAEKMVRSIFDEVYTKLLKKQVDKRNETSNKPFAVKLKYYEAYALSEVLHNARKTIGDMPYENNVCLKINNQIQKQL